MKNRPFHERFRFARHGIAAAWRGEASFRSQMAAAVAVFVLLLWLRPAALWWALTALTVGAVLAAELFNTALERVLDRLHPDHHPVVKIAKDCAAGAVLVLSLSAVGVLAALLADVLMK